MSDAVRPPIDGARTAKQGARMEIPRRTFLGAVGAAAVAASVPRGLDAVGNVASGNAAPLAQDNLSKVRFWVAACTPCDKNLKFEEAIYKDMMAWFKEQGADGIVVLGTTGEYPSFSIAERKKAAEVALKHANGLDMIISSGTTNVPETIELLQARAGQRRERPADHPALLLQTAADRGADQVLLDGLRRGEAPDQPVSHPWNERCSDQPGSAAQPGALSESGRDQDSDPPPQDYENFANAFPKLNMRTGISANLERAFNHDMGAILMEGNLFTKQIAAVFAAKRAGKDITEPLATFREAMKILRPAGVGSVPAR